MDAPPRGLKGNSRRGDVASSAGRAAYRKGTKFTSIGIGAVIFWETNPCSLFLLYFQRTATRPVPRMEEPVSTVSQTGRNLFRSRARAFPIIILNGPKCLRSLGCLGASLLPFICLKNLMDHFRLSKCSTNFTDSANVDVLIIHHSQVLERFIFSLKGRGEKRILSIDWIL